MKSFFLLLWTCTIIIGSFAGAIAPVCLKYIIGFAVGGLAIMFMQFAKEED